MVRELNSNVITPNTVTSDVVHLIRVTYWDGAEQEIRLTDAVSDLAIDVGEGAGVETWTGSGVLFSISEVEESSDLDAPGVDVMFDGVDQAIISIIINNQFRGRPFQVWRVWIDPTTGVQGGGASPVLMFDGFQNEPYTVSESFTDDPDAVAVATRVVGAVSRVNRQRAVRSNEMSHNEMIESAGLTNGDTFFRNVAAIDGVEVFWGRKGPSVPAGKFPSAPGSGGSPNLPGGGIIPTGRGA